MIFIIEVIVFESIGFYEIVRNLFFCGLIIGVLKLSVMQIVWDFEIGLCGVYIGLIGYLVLLGDFCFNVVICMLVLCDDGIGDVGIGLGVVFDFVVGVEYDECVLKLKFMMVNEFEFDLIEIMVYDFLLGFLFLDWYLFCLKILVVYFGFQFNELEFRVELDWIVVVYIGVWCVWVLFGCDGVILIFLIDLILVDSIIVFNVVLVVEMMYLVDCWFYYKIINCYFYDDIWQWY